MYLENLYVDWKRHSFRRFEPPNIEMGWVQRNYETMEENCRLSNTLDKRMLMSFALASSI